ncbi:uncharacterized protein MONBRDRAFT_33074 [Monosiga brevicollis MX1]|uniref:Peptidyl-prolyl cis-trans isomerase n=1 Tax=Monosiga brevicollis TaxID=81824 RepID=A9V3D3_MONBE|nr:uncharacterized protein MONBRDRAFT_33074 [Monosiga brevicollis MX1]EDQ88039.1 predicted protein [Monosiga brevicollis MX1]|eukprot:XP_001747115.1 hypothetical protein [Monosiga brevicollis MX1]
MAVRNPRVFFDVAIGSQPAKRMVFELFKKQVPKTSENFRALCTGEKGLGVSQKPLHFKNTRFHRIIPQFMAQGGDFTHHNGYGGESIYGARFEDENFEVRHDRRGLLSMANAGPNTNGSQFFVTMVPTPHLDGRHVVFGELVSGFSVLDNLEAIGSGSGTPLEDAIIQDCGELDEIDE